MKKIILHTLLLSGAAIMMLSCNKQPVSYTVTGCLPDSSSHGEKIYIVSYDLEKLMDSTVVNGNAFEFKGSADTAIFCRVDVNRQYVNFILENGNIVLDFEKHVGIGTPFNDKIAEISIVEDSFHNEINRFRSNLNAGNLTKEQARKQSDDFFKNVWKPKYINYYKSIYDANKNNDLGFYAYIGFHHYLSVDEHKALLEDADSLFLNKQTVKRISADLAAREITAEGRMFIDFAIDTPDGGKIALSDYVGRGKYTLVDFWASWCGPCIAELPVIREVYEKYKGKITVLGVAVWDDPDATIKSVTENKISWPQIINAQSIPTKLYGINGIPHIILFGPDGTIIARELRGEKLQAKVAEVMGL